MFMGAAVAGGAGAKLRRRIQQRPFGRTGLKVSALGFGGAGIGGTAFGAVSRADALAALGAAEDLGCNFIDTARLYGASESLLGDFLRGRRDRWVVATKYSGQKAGMRATLEEQLTRLGTDHLDLYQIHWVPKGDDAMHYDELAALRSAGKTRFIGVSASTAGDIDYLLGRGGIDCVQLPFNLLLPEPMSASLPRLRAAGMAVIARSILREGFLTGKFDSNMRFDPRQDVRGGLDERQLAERHAGVERFRFLTGHASSLTEAAIRYALSFEGISTAIIGTKTRAQAVENFGAALAGPLSAEALAAIERAQREA